MAPQRRTILPHFLKFSFYLENNIELLGKTQHKEKSEEGETKLSHCSEVFIFSYFLPGFYLCYAHPVYIKGRIRNNISILPFSLNSVA